MDGAGVPAHITYMRYDASTNAVVEVVRPISPQHFYAMDELGVHAAPLPRKGGRLRPAYAAGDLLYVQARKAHYATNCVVATHVAPECVRAAEVEGAARFTGASMELPMCGFGALSARAVRMYTLEWTPDPTRRTGNEFVFLWDETDGAYSCADDLLVRCEFPTRIDVVDNSAR